MKNEFVSDGLLGQICLISMNNSEKENKKHTMLCIYTEKKTHLVFENNQADYRTCC